MYSAKYGVQYIYYNNNTNYSKFTIIFALLYVSQSFWIYSKKFQLVVYNKKHRFNSK